MTRAPSREVLEHDHEEPDFLISAPEGSGRAHHTLKHDDAFAIIDTHGDIGAAGPSADGLFFNDTRYLSRLELLVARSTPLLLNSTIDEADLQFCCDLTNPDIFVDGKLALHKDAVHIYRTSYVRDGAIRQRLCVTNHTNVDLPLTLAIAFDCDFADIFEVRGMRRPKRGQIHRTVQANQSVAFSYEGLDTVVRRTLFRIEPAPASLKETVAIFNFTLKPKVAEKIFITAIAEPGTLQTHCSYAKGVRDAHRLIRRTCAEATSVGASSPDVDAVLKRSIADLRLLTTTTSDGPYPYAGTPWYSTTFGRDALITALQTLWLDPSIARGVLRRLARYQAKDFDAEADAQPGKILHEMRGGEMAALREIPFGLYYGSVDSTPLFVAVAGAYHAATGDKSFLQEIWPAVTKALDWIDGPADLDGDGFVEYMRETEHGLANQGWKDSHDSVFHSDGTLARGPIALVEVQGYVYAAKTLAADMATELGFDEKARDLRASAERLREKFEQSFWCDDTGSYALALDGEKRAVRVRSSNAGHVLSSGIASKDRAKSVIDQMLSPSFFSGWGIRTIATSEARYNPMSYHNGSIWPHDNAMIASGFARYGQSSRIEPIFDSLLDAACKMDQRRLPELFCGFRRRNGRAPILYPVACSPQAWSSGAMFQILSAMLGLTVDAKAQTIRLTAPVVPKRAGAITIRNIQTGGASADFVVESKENSGVTLDVLAARGGAKVVMV